MYSVVLMVLTSVTIAYAVNNIINLVKLDQQTSDELGEVLPTSAYVYTTLNYVFRIAIIYISMMLMQKYGFPLTESNVFWIVLVLLGVSTFLSTLLEAVLRTAILLARAERGDEGNEER